MLMEFPTIFYRSPGPNQGNGHTWDSIGVPDSAAAVDLLAQGWVATYAELVEPKIEAKATNPEEAPSDDAPPTRAEIEAKATELGIRFKPSTADRDILAKITAALAGA